VEKALLGRALDVDALIQALEALPQDLHPTPTPGTSPWPAYTILSVQGKLIQQADLCSIARLCFLLCFGTLLMYGFCTEHHVTLLQE